MIIIADDPACLRPSTTSLALAPFHGIFWSHSMSMRLVLMATESSRLILTVDAYVDGPESQLDALYKLLSCRSGKPLFTCHTGRQGVPKYFRPSG